MNLCPLCLRPAPNNGEYQFNHPCCRARFLHTLPDNTARKGWAERWRKQGHDGQATRKAYEHLKTRKQP